MMVTPRIIKSKLASTLSSLKMEKNRKLLKSLFGFLKLRKIFYLFKWINVEKTKAGD